MVLLVSLLAAFALFAAFFATVWLLRRFEVARPLGALASAAAGGLAWYIAVKIGQSTGAVTTDEATFHHLYVLAVVGLPLVGAVLLVQGFRRPAIEGASPWFVRGIAIAFIVPAFIGIWATHIEPTRLRLDEQTIEVGAAPDGAPIRVGVIADIQTDVFTDYEDRVVDRMLELEPDLILVAGDYTQLEWEGYLRIKEDLVDLLSRLDAPHGVYVILGNTDPGPLELQDVVSRSGHVSLIDETTEVEVRGQRIRIGGLAWPNNNTPGSRAFVSEFAESGSSDVVDILLAHSPDSILNVGDGSGVDLMVSGHTHGGQISIPFLGPLWNVTELPGAVAGGGVHDVRGATTYVSTGVGVQRGESPKVRFLVRPSIGLLTLD
ncbi:MAG: metallophosphoesterase [Acidimicrobiales bacterium]